MTIIQFPRSGVERTFRFPAQGEQPQPSEVRTAIDEQGNAWFCAKDVAAVLGIVWTNTVLENMPERWVTIRLNLTVTGDKETTFISEPGLYRLILRSRKPEAERFAEWVCEDVLPTIRKTGAFGTLDVRQQISLTNTMMRLSAELVNTRDAFQFSLLQRRLHDLCNMMGQPMPDLDLIGKDRSQLDLPGV